MTTLHIQTSDPEKFHCPHCKKPYQFALFDDELSAYCLDHTCGGFAKIDGFLFHDSYFEGRDENNQLLFRKFHKDSKGNYVSEDEPPFWG